MKKILSIALALTILLSFAACKKGEEPATVTTNAPTEQTQNTTADESNTEPTEPIADRIPEQAPMAAISLPVSTTTDHTENDVLLFTYQCQTMYLIIPDKEIEDRVILDFQKRLDRFSESATEYSQRAKDDYNGSENWTPYFYNILYSPTRIDLSVLSLYGTNTSWAGGAHPTHNCTSANYDLMTGDVLTLGSILTHEDSLDQLCALIISEVAEIKAEKFIMDDYENIIRNRFSKNESYNEAWFFSTEGLSFYFSPYEIAPYSSGTISVTIPYENLTGIIEDQYFPAEQEITTGTIQAIKQNDTNITNFSQIAEVILDKDGEMIFLFTDRSVQNISIEIGSWNTDRNEFIVDYTVFAAPILTPGDAIMIQTIIPENEPNIRLVYTTQSECVTEYISQQSSDKTIILIDENDI